MLRVQTSFQDTPGDGYYFVLFYNDQPLEGQLSDLSLEDGDTVLLWDPECDDYTVEAVLLFSFQHPLDYWPRLWARESNNSN